MRYNSVQIVFQEIPTEISLGFQITGCPLRCSGCHSSHLWNSKLGSELDIATLSTLIAKYRNYISCVLYLGGEWHVDELIAQLDHVRSHDLKTALYTGLDYFQVDSEVLRRLDYLKYGEYNAALGPLSSARSNQKLVNIKTNEILNHYFIHGGEHDSVRC
ncbi:MAG: anaerobic ribonucleoside-triphosphate reductase activating protein [Bdellovibrionaceae bacterium]|nr:anaerobic ribonucleoside-triphosphate reductase activating protein [Pseudobdellovibrionaceae bacterium]